MHITVTHTGTTCSVRLVGRDRRFEARLHEWMRSTPHEFTLAEHLSWTGYISIDDGFELRRTAERLGLDEQERGAEPVDKDAWRLAVSVLRQPEIEEEVVAAYHAARVRSRVRLDDNTTTTVHQQVRVYTLEWT